MKAVRSIGLGLLVGPAIGLAVLAGTSQSAHAAVPAKDIGFGTANHNGLALLSGLNLNLLGSQTAVEGYGGGGYGGGGYGLRGCYTPYCC